MVSRNPPRTGPVSAPETNDRNAAASGGEQTGSWPQGFHDAAAEYFTTLTQISSGMQEKQRGALEGLQQAPAGTAQSALPDDLTSAYRDLLDAIQKQDVEKIKSIQSAYLSRVQSAYSDAEASTRNRQTDYTNAVQSALQDAKGDLSAAFQNYINTLKSGFAKLPAGSADPAAVAAIGQSMAAVAGYAYFVAQAMALPPPNKA
jgi:hypothetical protein